MWETPEDKIKGDVDWANLTVHFLTKIASIKCMHNICVLHINFYSYFQNVAYLAQR